MNKRTLLLFLCILISAFALSACNPFASPSQNAASTTIEQQASTASSQTVTVSQSQTQTSNQDSTTASASAKITIELTAVNPRSGQTAFELLKESGAQVTAESYGDAGSFITSINDLKGDSDNYWAFYINDQYANQAADKTVVKHGDRVKFVYERVLARP